MVSRSRSLCAVLAVATHLSTVAGSPASAADADVLIVQGSGTITPGLGLVVPEPQSVSFTGTATVVGTHSVDALLAYDCDFAGTFVAAFLASGTGTMSGSCGPIVFPFCIVGWAGNEWAWHCTEIPSLTSARTTTWDCVFTAHDVDPTTNYSLVCGGGYAGAP